MNILVVDSEVVMVESIRRGMGPKGYLVLEAFGAQQALDQLYHGGHKIDMVVTNHQMPAMNGIDLLLAIRKTHPTLPVVIITAHARTSLVIEDLKDRYDCIIEKPFTRDQLVAEIERIRLHLLQIDKEQGMKQVNKAFAEKDPVLQPNAAEANAFGPLTKAYE
jgi:DNA-binding NtrC family response regulator